MKKITMSAVALTAIMGSFSSVSAADGVNILDNIKLTGEIRPRYEYANVKQNKRDKANAYTARTKLNINANLLGIEGLTTNIGIISVNNFGSDKYDSKANGQTQYDIIKDPQYAMISNADINYQVDKTILHAGRGQVNLDNQRFIGTVGWRQLERSYDSVFVANNSVKNLSLLAAWVYGVQGVGAAPTVDANSILLHAAYTVMPELKITAYDYMLSANGRIIGIPNIGGVGFDTYGVAFTGKIAPSGIKLNYRAEYAVQKDATMKMQETATNAGNFKADASYYNLDLGANINGILAGVNYEFLSGENASGTETAFNPKLGTNHKFNGWADEFYVAHTPSGGLKDANIRLGYKAKGFGKLLGVYHDFKADTAMPAASGTTDDLGSEFDIVYVNAIPGVKNLKGLVKFASYSKGQSTEFTYNKDKTVAWAQLDYKFATK